MKVPKLIKIAPKSVKTSFGANFLKHFFAQCSMECRDFEKVQKKSDRAFLLRLPTKRYVKMLGEKLYLEKLKRKNCDNTVISFTKEWFRVNAIIEYNSFRIKV